MIQKGKISSAQTQVKMTTYQVISEAFVNVFITTNVSSVKSERKFSKELTIFDLKGKLELITGALTAQMDISVYDKNDDKKLVCELDDDNRLLGSYPIDSGMNLFVKDRTKVGISNKRENGKQLGEFEDVSKGKLQVLLWKRTPPISGWEPI